MILPIEFYSAMPEIRLDRSRSIEGLLTIDEKIDIDTNWSARVKEGHFDSELGSLWGNDGCLRYISMLYKTYDYASSRQGNGERVNDALRVYARPSAVCITLATVDEKIIVQKRAGNIFAAGKLDCSAAGVCQIKDGRLDFYKHSLEKIKRELNLGPEDFTMFERSPYIARTLEFFVSLHLYKGCTKKTLEEIQSQANPKFVERIISVDASELSSFIIDHFAVKQDLIAPGCASLLSSLDNERFFGTIAEINKKGGDIKFGRLADGLFIEG